MIQLTPGTLQKAAVGHRTAAAALVDFVYHYACLISRSRQSEVDDLTQEVFQKVLVAVREGRLDPQKNESAYVITVVRNAFLDARRASDRHRARFEQEPGEQEVPDGLDLESELRQRERCRAVEGVLEVLHADERALLSLKFDQELSNADIAEALRINDNTVKSRLHRLIERVRRMVGARLSSRSGVLAFPSRRAKG